MNDDLCCAGIYAIRHVESGKVYVGQSQNVRKRMHEHQCPASGCTHLRNAIKRDGWDAFEIVILERVYDLALLNAREQYWIDTLHACDRDKGYNLCPTAGSVRGIKHSAEARANMSAAHMNPTIEIRTKLRESHLGKTLTEEHKAKLRITSSGRKHTAEAKAKISATQLGKPKNSEAIAKMRATKVGKRLTPEHIAKISAANRGKKRSAEFCTRMSRRQRGRIVSDEEVEKIRATLLNNSHAAEHTHILIDYLGTHPNDSLRSIAQNTDIPYSTVYGLLLRAGWHFERGVGWQPREDAP